MKQEVKSSMTIGGQVDAPGYRMIAALVKGSINGVPLAYLEFVARDKNLDLGDLVGTEMGFWVEDETGQQQPFWGTCISAESKGSAHGEGHFIAEIRPWLWFLSRTKNNRIFQEIKATDIIKEVLGKYGFSGDLKVNHSGTDQVRTYCVQYGESDLDFIKRLLEDEGFYFYFEYDESTVKMVLADQPSTHGSAGEGDKYLYADEIFGGAREQITSWQLAEKVVTGKVTLRDYDFTKPSSDLTSKSTQPKGSHAHKSYEDYIYPGGYSDLNHGDKRAAALVEEHASGHQVWSATGTMLNLNVGKIFEIVDHPHHETAADNGFMVSSMTQYVSIGAHTINAGAALLSDASYWKNTAEQSLDTVRKAMQGAKGVEFSDVAGYFQTVFEAVKKSVLFRGPGLTPRPQMIGVQTAVVTGASGDEIAVDQYGRIKVQFHWDRDGKNDDKTSCWVRTMMPWTGKNWGMVALPRVGQEVVIQFEEGDPDRPLCVGMLYNADTMPPYPLPGNATRTGIKSNSSKGGGGYNELMLEDKKGDELVRFMAEKDYFQNVQNQAHIKVGYDHPKDVRKAEAQDDKSMKLEVQNHLDEIVETGDHSFTVMDGNQTIGIKLNQDIKVEKNATMTVTDNFDTTVENGDMTISVDNGSMTTSVTSGNISVSASSGKIAMEAAQEIKLTCGASTITMKPQEITIESVNVSVKANAALTAEGTATADFKSSGMATLKGSLVQIN